MMRALFFLISPFVLQMLAKKVDTLITNKKMIMLEVVAMEKEVTAMRVDKDQEMKAMQLGNSKQFFS